MTKIIGLNDSIKFKDGKTYDVLWFDRSGIKLQARKGGTRLMPLSEFENLKPPSLKGSAHRIGADGGHGFPPCYFLLKS